MQEEIKENLKEDRSHELEQKCDEYLNNWKRAQADFENYKKGEIERMAMLGGYAKESVFLNMLPIIDSIYLAQAAFGKDGFLPIEKQIQEFLKKEGIEEIKTEGEKFNPETMEIIGETEGDGESGMVVEEIQKGYRMGEKVIRPAKVKVSK